MHSSCSGIFLMFGASFSGANSFAAQTFGALAHGIGTSGVTLDLPAMLFVFMLSTFIGVGVIRRVSRLLHTPLMSLTNAISAIAVVGAILVTGSDYPTHIRFLGAVALFATSVSAGSWRASRRDARCRSSP